MTEGNVIIMASDREYLMFILDGLSELEGITYRAMMGEFIIYFHGRIVGGIYDNRLLVKPVPAALAYMKQVIYELPYNGGKPMLLVDDADDRDYMSGLFLAMYEELPERMPKTKKKDRA